MSNELKVGDRVAATGNSTYGLPVAKGALGTITQAAARKVRVLLDEPIDEEAGIGTGDGGELMLPGLVLPGWTFGRDELEKVEE